MNPNDILGKPLMQEMAPHSTYCSRKALTFLSFAVGLGLTVLLAFLACADISEGQHSAITMPSIVPQHQMAFGKKALSWQPRPLSPFQPSFSQQKPRNMGVAAQAFNPPPFSVTNDKFANAYPKFLPPLFSSFITDVVNELHFYVYDIKYKYDPLFALGLREFFAAGSGAYDQIMGGGEGEKLWSAICAAVDLDGAQVTKDAETITSYAKSTAPADILKQMEGTEKPSDSLLESAFDEFENYNQFRSIGLFKIMEFSGVQLDKDKAKEWAKAAKIDNSRFMKDLQNFRSNLRRIQEGEEMMKAMQARREKNVAAKKAKEESKEEKPKAETA